MLILLLSGFQAGVYQQATAYLDHTPADWVVAQDGVTNMLSATSLLPASTEDLARMAIDPVCGMSVDRANAPAQALYDGQVIYFYAAGCRDEFLATPERFWERTGQTGGAL